MKYFSEDFCLWRRVFKVAGSYPLFNTRSGLLVLVFVLTATCSVVSNIEAAMRPGEPAFAFPPLCQQLELSAPEDRGAWSRAWTREPSISTQREMCVKTAFEMWLHTRRNQISSFGETDESIKIGGGINSVDYWQPSWCASAVVMLDTTCSEVVWRVLATHSIRQFVLHFPCRASPCAITFQLDSTSASPSKSNVNAVSCG
jgi:hypothetical protein